MVIFSKEHVDKHIEYLSVMHEYSKGKKIIEFHKKQQDEISHIKKVLESRKIKKLIHFTRLENLNSILTKGFLSRDMLDVNNIPFIWNDKERLDDRTDCTCFSVEFPNNYLFKKFRQDEINCKWVVLEIDSRLLLEHRGDKYFCYNNAARADIRQKLKNKELKNWKDFENMFCEEEKYDRSTGSGTKLRNSILNIKDYLPTSEQAEILISGKISNKYIRGVYFNSESDYGYYRSIITSNINIYNLLYHRNKSQLSQCMRI